MAQIEAGVLHLPMSGGDYIFLAATEKVKYKKGGSTSMSFRASVPSQSDIRILWMKQEHPWSKVKVVNNKLVTATLDVSSINSLSDVVFELCVTVGGGGQGEWAYGGFPQGTVQHEACTSSSKRARTPSPPPKVIIEP